MKFLNLCLILTFISLPAFAQEKTKETAYDRVIRTGILRCGYITWPPFFEKDIKTGQFRGMNYDYVTAIAKSLGLTIDWASEVSVGQSIEELRSGKIDAVCSAEGPLFPSTTKYLAYSKAFAYFPFFLYAREGDYRFDNNLKAINSKDIQIALLDGDISSEIVDTYFPNATRHSMAQTASPTQIFMEVASGKADLFIDGDISVTPFIMENPKTVRKVKVAEPLAVIPNTFSVLRGPEGNDLLLMLNQSIENLQNRGQDTKIFAPYFKNIPNMLYPVARPYEQK